MAKSNRPLWWKMFYHQRAAIESVSNEDAGQGLKAAFRYFDGEDVFPDELTPAAFTVFCVIRPYIDESKRDYEETSEKNRKNISKRWNNTTGTSGINKIPLDTKNTEEEVEEEVEVEEEGE